jgi:putative heme transporter
VSRGVRGSRRSRPIHDRGEALEEAARSIVSVRIPHWFATAGRAAWLLLGIVGVLVVVALFFASVSGLLIPLVAAVVLAAIVVPLVDGLERLHLPRWLGATLVLLLGIAIVLGTTVIVVRVVVEQGARIAAAASAAMDEARGALGYIELDPETVTRAVRSGLELLLGGVVGPALGSVGTLLVGVGLAIFLLLFILKDWYVLLHWTAGHLGMGVPRELGQRILDDAVHVFRAYALGLTLIGAANAATVAIGLWLIGVPLVGPIALVTFLTSYVPYLGAFVSGALAVVVALGSGGLSDALLALAIVLLANNTLQNLLEPFAFGRPLRLHPVVVLIATTAGTLLFGVTGAVLAAPVTSVVVRTVADLDDAGLFDELTVAAPEPP